MSRQKYLCFKFITRDKKFLTGSIKVATLQRNKLFLRLFQTYSIQLLRCRYFLGQDKVFLKASKKKHLVLCHNLFILLYCGIVSPPGRLYEGQHHHHERMFDSSHIPAINITLHSPNANRVLGRAEYILKLMRVPINYIWIRIQTENFSYSDIKKTGKKLRNKPRDITIVYTYYTYSSPFVKLFGNYMFPPLLVPGFLILAAPAPMVIGSIADTYRYR